MEMTLTIRGSVDELQRALARLGATGDSPDTATSERLRRFVWDCTGDMLAVVNVVASHSSSGRPVARADVIVQADLADEGRLNGVTGSIGRAWARHVGGDNPFLGKSLSGEVVYQLDAQFAAELIELVAGRTAAMAARPEREA